MKSGKIRALVVDDSAYARVNISKHLNADPDIEVVGTARDGFEALEMIRILRPNVVTLDVSMPRMDGLTALEHIMEECPTPVIMLSVLTAAGTWETIRALELGAVDFFLKPSIATPAGTSKIALELRKKIKQAAQVPVSKLHSMSEPTIVPHRIIPRTIKPRRRQHRKVVVIGCSTGGPQALNDILPHLPGDLPAAVLVVQHMHPGFTKSLAGRLAKACEIAVREAEDGDLLVHGQALLAPGDWHMIVDSDHTVCLNQNRTECGVRPSVNVTLASVAKHFGPDALAVILTGMGTDGARGATLLKAAGGKVYVEDESTAIIYGMPKAVVEAGSADKILPRGEIADEIVLACGDSESEGAEE